MVRALAGRLGLERGRGRGGGRDRSERGWAMPGRGSSGGGSRAVIICIYNLNSYLI